HGREDRNPDCQRQAVDPGDRPARLAAAGSARETGPDRYPPGLRYRPVRCLHRPRRRARDQVLLDPGAASGRTRGHHDRGPRAGRRAPSRPGGLPRMPRPAVRLLHPGHGHVGRRPARREPEAQRGRDPGAPGGQHLPLHRLPEHRQGRPARRRRDRLRDNEQGEMEMTDMSNSPIGQRVARREDKRFLTGTGRYPDDIVLPRQPWACFVRSPHAHARIAGIDTAPALASPGVVAVFTGEDLAASGVGGLPCGWLIHSKDGSPMKEPPHPVLAVGKARYVGDPVAIVIAEDYASARDAAELVAVQYEVLDAVVDTASAETAAVLVHDDVPNNLCYHWSHGDESAVDTAFASASHVARLELVNNRLIPNAIEPRAANAEYSAHDDSYTL